MHKKIAACPTLVCDIQIPRDPTNDWALTPRSGALDSRAPRVLSMLMFAYTNVVKIFYTPNLV